eukprot:COSAG06_NODE_860_length_11903_cov_3.097170_5_plen_73_part_00
MASLSPRTAPIPFVHAPRNSTILPAHTQAASLADTKPAPSRRVSTKLVRGLHVCISHGISPAGLMQQMQSGR